MWIVPPSIRLAFFLESGCLTKDCTPDLDLWASEAERSCTLNGKPTRSQSWKQGCKKAPYLMRLSGLAICANLTQSSFQAWWIASLRASRAKTCHLQAAAPGLTASAAGCSLKSPALPVVAVRDTSFWRTSQASLLPPPPLWTKPKALSTNAQPPASWENWPTSGGMRNGRLFQRPTLEPATGGRGGFAGHGAWTTPVATEHQKDRMTDEAMARELVRPSAGMALCKDVRFWASPKASDGQHGGPNMRGSKGELPLPSQAAKWATPQARDHKNPDKPESGNYQRKLEQGYTIDLNSQAAKWATPDCNTNTYSNGKMGPNIREQAANWPTPCAAVMSDGETPETWHARAATLKQKHGNGNGAGLPLTVAAMQWPTPNAMDCNMTNQPRKDGGQVQLTNAAGAWLPPSSPQAQPTQPGQESSSTGPTSHRRLNPAFTEWLMGWSIGWTIAAPSASSAAATASFRLKLATLLASSLPELKGLFDEKM